jgi:hypothetical protein
MATPEQHARRVALWKECAGALLFFFLIVILPAIADTITS